MLRSRYSWLCCGWGTPRGPRTPFSAVFGHVATGSGGVRGLALAPLPPQVGLHELVEVAVEDAVHVAGLVLVAEVLDHLVGLHDIRADLAAEAHRPLLAADRRQLGLALLALHLGQLGLEDLHGPVL